MLERAKAVDVLHHANRQPGKENWLGAGAGKSGLSWNYSIWMKDKSGVELYIDTGDAKENESVFDSLFAHRPEIETIFGGHLDWERLDGKRACRIRHLQRHGGLQSPEEDWPDIQAEMIGCMDRLVESVGSHLADL